jgi:hypothetical protein
MTWHAEVRRNSSKGGGLTRYISTAAVAGLAVGLLLPGQARAGTNDPSFDCRLARTVDLERSTMRRLLVGEQTADDACKRGANWTSTSSRC